MENIKLSTNFTLNEFQRSATADKYKIDNTIPEKYMENLKRLVKVLQIIRDEYGFPIKVSSGYRCKALNTKVGGAKNSDHVYMAACDCHSKEDTTVENKKIFDIVVKLANEGKIECRLIIDEYNYNWIHISVNNDYNSHKKNEILHIK